MNKATSTAVIISMLLTQFGCMQKSNRGIITDMMNTKEEAIKTTMASSTLINYNRELNFLKDSLKTELKNLLIIIDKTDYTLTLKKDSLTIKQYPVVFGENPVDDKLQEGDNCTPEGTFKMVTKYPHRFWSRFILLNYPTEESLKKIRKAKEEGRIPRDASPGGAIGIHGVQNFNFRIDIRDNWTAGCISMKNENVNELYDVVDSNTIIIIKK